MQIGDTVIYNTSEGELIGTIHGIKKIDTKTGPEIIGYLVDTGADVSVAEVETPKGKPNIFVRQPVQVEVSPENIKPEK